MVKKIIYILLVFIAGMSNVLLAQQNSSTLKGTIQDSISTQPLELVTVNLKTKDGQLFKTVMSKATGEFQFDNLPKDSYRLQLEAVGYATKVISIEVSDEKHIEDLGRISISQSENVLKEVAVTASQRLVKQEIDRIGYHVQGDPESKFSSVLDILRKVPHISLDGDDNILVKGSASYRVLVNGRPSALLSQNPRDILKSMPASSILRIEVITSPPARYESEGLAGIINIITIKNKHDSYSGRLTLRQNFPNGPAWNALLTVKTGKLGVHGYTGILYTHTPAVHSGSFRTGTGTTSSQLLQTGDNRRSGHLGYVHIDLSYEIDSLNLLTGHIGSVRGRDVIDGNTISRLFDEAGRLTEYYVLHNEGRYKPQGHDYGLNYQLGFRRHREQMLTVSYSYVNNNNRQNGSFFTTEKLNYAIPDFAQAIQSGNIQRIFQLDYQHPTRMVNIEAGMRFLLRDNFFYYNQMDKNQNGEYVPNSDRTNEFENQQNVFGIYNSYHFQLKGWGVKAGVRMERTFLNANFLSTATKVEQLYNHFIPSLLLQYTLQNRRSLNFGYTQRIERPGVRQLNPFVNRDNPRVINTGNPDLKAVIRHTIETSYSKYAKGSFNIGLNYGFASNTIEYIASVKDDISTYTFSNAGSNKTIGFDAGFNYPVTPKFSINANGRMAYVHLRGAYNGEVFANKGVTGNASVNANYRFNKGWRMGMTSSFSSPAIRLQGWTTTNYFTSLNLNKQAFKDKAAIAVTASNPWSKVRRIRNETRGIGFIEERYTDNYFRAIIFSFAYQFGKLKGEIKKNRRGINNDL